MSVSGSHWRRARAPLGLAAVVVVAGACALLGGDETGNEGPPAASVAPHTAVAARGDARQSSSKCSECHELESVDEHWRTRAMAIGHDPSLHAATKTSCTCCHLGPIEDFGEPSGERCTECHEHIQVTIPAMAQTHCLACHNLDAAADIRETAWECQQCHGVEEDGAPLIDVHGSQPCESCHKPHEEPWVEERLCSDCHAGKDHVEHGPSRSEQLVCRDCHEPHENAGEATNRCVTCHEEDHPKQFETTLFEGHDACTNCHAPHGFEATAAAQCTDCHADHSMAADMPLEHRNCSSCHATHAPRSVGGATCKGCHDDVDVDHADNATEVCTTCHDPHGGSKGHEKGAKDCTSCHSDVAQEDVAHGGKAACESCHKPHAFTAAKAPTCGSCHQKQQHDSATHAVCASCHGDAHEPHGGGGSCASCHADESKSLTKGHAACTQCHDGHTKSLLPGAAKCTSCHATKTKGPHDGVVGSCTTCHRPHGPAKAGLGAASPPTCGSCHTTKKNDGMHAVSGHEQCAGCHTSHQAPQADRARCIGCHEDQKAHQQSAKVCNGCHTFKGF